MLTFKEIEIGDRAVLEPILRKQPYRICDHAFSCLYMWENTYRARFCLEDGILYLAYEQEDGSLVYQMPLGAGSRLAEAVERIMEDAKERGAAFRLVAFNTQMKEELEAAMPGRFAYTESPDTSDYIYDAESLRELRGKKLHAKRNYINRFIAEHEGDYAFEAIDRGNSAEVLAFNCQWDREHGSNDDYLREADAISRAIFHLDEIGMMGVALRLEGKIIAFALGTQLSEDTILEQIEKAIPLPGAYQMINNEFARRFSEGFAYINREEDLGIEGLRKSKLSYFPAYINLRWIAEPHD